MLYLLFRIAVFLVAAACLGFGVGWFVRQVRSGKYAANIQKQLNTARSRVPLLESSLKDRKVDCKRLRQELMKVENRFVQAGALIAKRDSELVELERKITRLNNTHEPSTALDSLESSHSRQIVTLEEMLAEEQLKVANFISSQDEACENARLLSDEVSELRSAESQHESELLGLEEQLTRSRQAQLKLASGYNAGIEARKQLEYARETEVRLVQRHRELELTIQNLESMFLPNEGVEPAVLYGQLPDNIDNLQEIKGLGVAAEKQLNSLGIYHFQQLAEFNSCNIDWVEKQHKKLKGRFKRDNWIAQATHLLNSVPQIRNSDPGFY